MKCLALLLLGCDALTLRSPDFTKAEVVPPSRVVEVSPEVQLERVVIPVGQPVDDTVLQWPTRMTKGFVLSSAIWASAISVIYTGFWTTLINLPGVGTWWIQTGDDAVNGLVIYFVVNCVLNTLNMVKVRQGGVYQVQTREPDYIFGKAGAMKIRFVLAVIALYSTLFFAFDEMICQIRGINAPDGISPVIGCEDKLIALLSAFSAMPLAPMIVALIAVLYDRFVLFPKLMLENGE